MVGGFRTKHDEVPFIVAFADLEQKLDKKFCTGKPQYSTIQIESVVSISQYSTLQYGHCNTVPMKLVFVVNIQ